MAEFLDKHRVFSLLLIAFACYLVYEISFWFMALPTPNNAQAGFASTFGLSIVGLLKYYLENRISK